MTKSINLTFPTKREFVSVARLVISGLAPTLPFDEETVEDLKIALSEVCSTIILSTEKNPDAKQTVELSLTVAEDFFQIDVDTKGAVIDLTSFAPLVWAEPKEPGFGLSIVTALMDKVEFVTNHQGRATLRLKKYYPVTT